MIEPCSLNCPDQVRKIARIIMQLQRAYYHGSLIIDFNKGIPQVQRLRKIEVVDALRK